MMHQFGQINRPPISSVKPVECLEMIVGEHEIEAVEILHHVGWTRTTDHHAQTHLEAIAEQYLWCRPLHLFGDLEHRVVFEEIGRLVRGPWSLWRAKGSECSH